MLNYFLTFLAALALGLVLIASIRRFALKFHLLGPEGVSRLGGLGIWLAFSLVSILALWHYGYLSKIIWGIVAGSFLIVVFGIVDDYKKELSISFKFLVQLIATFLLILSGVRTQIAYIGPYLNLAITFIWILGITNAFNHLDILDGLAGGIAAICAATFFIIALFSGNTVIAILSLVLTAALLSFLRYNLSSAKVYMGNSGSHFLGFALAAIAITISYASLEKKIALICPILILGLPIYDTVFLILRRSKKRRSIFKKSADHLALRFLAGGYSQSRVLIVMYLLGLFFSLSGLMISWVSNQMSIFLLALVVALCLVIAQRELAK